MSNAPNKFFGGRDLKQCPICSRYFITHRIKAHEAICQKSTSTTRKYFDVSQQRIGGTDFEKIAKKMGNGTEYTEISVSSAFILIIKE